MPRISNSAMAAAFARFPAPDEIAMHFICTRGLVDRFRERYPRAFRYGGNRALLFDIKGKVPQKALRHSIALALTYRLRRSR